MSEDNGNLVRKIAGLLGAVAETGRSGTRLIDLTRQLETPRPTVHRWLKELVEVGYVERHGTRYAIGPGVYPLALSAPFPIRDFHRVQDSAQALADECGDTVYVGVRHFDGVSYVVRAEGNYPLRSQVAIGEHRSLAQSYCGIALLASVDAAEQDRVIAARVAETPPELAAGRETALRSMLGQINTLHYCWGNDMALPGLAGIAAPIPAERGVPWAAVSISAPSLRMPPARVGPLARRLLATARDMQDCFNR
jgi:DNA-binding IclR family transcriptional regulator